MSWARRWAGALFALWILPGAGAGQDAPASATTNVSAVPADTAARIDSVFARFTTPAPSPGCALDVVRDGRSIYAHGYGYASLEQRVRVTPGTVFDIGSTSKQFTAMSILLLTREGKLSLDDDVRKYLPELPDLGHVTIRQLLNHTSGWRDYTDLMALAGWDERDHTGNREALEPLTRQGALNFAPGTAWRYSNTGYFLAGLIVARVSGKPLREFARERIFAPLGMTHTLFLDDTRRIVPGRATGYAPADSGGWVVEMSNWDQVGDGAVQTSVQDLERWDANFYTPTVGDEAVLREMQTPGRLADGTATGYGKGLAMDEHAGVRRVQHGGAWAGYRAMLARYPDRRLSVIVLCNAANSRPDQLADGVADLFLGPPPAARAAPAPALAGPAAGDDARRLAGRFRGVGMGGLYVLAAVGPALALRGDTLRAAGGDRYRSDRSRLELRFLAAGRRAVLSRSGLVQDTLERVEPAATDVARRLNEFTGTYASDELATTWTILARDGRLVLHRARGEDLPLRPEFLDAFTGGYGGTLRFLRDATGRVTAISIDTRGVHDLRLTHKGS